MDEKALGQALSLAQRTGQAFLATADAAGVPHVAIAGRLFSPAPQRLVAEEWFCPTTVTNLAVNANVAIVVWDGAEDRGFQLLGRAESVADTAVLDGFLPGREAPALPQVRRSLMIRIERIVSFSRSPHSDQTV
jgi:hypothetical protein